jgi:predicted DNA-binding protein (UPF0251 family)
MPRPRKCRRICSLPETTAFQPLGKGGVGEVVMTIDEFETIRLIDLEGLTQELCAARMNVARTTVQAIYTSARGKLAQALVGGKTLRISGGDYVICQGDAPGCGCVCHGEAARQEEICACRCCTRRP